MILHPKRQTWTPRLKQDHHSIEHHNFVELFSQDFYNAIYIGIPFGFLTTNILFINQFPDTTSDAKTGKNHLVVTFGKKNSRWGYLILLSAAFLSSYLLLEIFQNNIADFGHCIKSCGVSTESADRQTIHREPAGCCIPMHQLARCNASFDLCANPQEVLSPWRLSGTNCGALCSPCGKPT